MEIPELRINGIPFHKTTFLIEDVPTLLQWNRDHPAQPINGLLGADAIRQKIIGIDFLNMSITTWSKEKLSVSEIQDYIHDDKPELNRWTTRVPLIYDSNSGRFSVLAKLESKLETFLLDTGSMVTVVNTKVGNSLHAHVDPMPVTLRELHSSVPSTVTYINSMRLGARLIRYPTVIVMPGVDVNVLGVSAFSDRKSIFDFKNRQIYFSAKQTQSELNQAVLPSIGFFTFSREDKFYALVQKNSLAEKAGIENDDEILDVVMEDNKGASGKEAVFTLLKHHSQLKSVFRIPANLPEVKHSDAISNDK